VSAPACATGTTNSASSERTRSSISSTSRLTVSTSFALGVLKTDVHLTTTGAPTSSCASAGLGTRYGQVEADATSCWSQSIPRRTRGAGVSAAPPSLLLNDQDRFADPTTPVALLCRLYATRWTRGLRRASVEALRTQLQLPS
jgi:hypothetical protein